LIRPPLLVVATSLLCLLACPQDPGDPDAGQTADSGPLDAGFEPDAVVLYDAFIPPRDAGPGCGEVPTSGHCDPDGVLQWCDDNEVQEADCTALGYDCGELPYPAGFWCLAGAGQSCQSWPCHQEMTCNSHRVCEGVFDAGAEDATSAVDAQLEDSGADAGAEDVPPSLG